MSRFFPSIYECLAPGEQKEYLILWCQIFSTPPVRTARWEERDFKRWEESQKILIERRDALIEIAKERRQKDVR